MALNKTIRPPQVGQLRLAVTIARWVMVIQCSPNIEAGHFYVGKACFA